MTTPDLKPCPFCGGTDIRFSMKITGHFEVRYHAVFYCNKCHCYGPRTLTKEVDHYDFNSRENIFQDDTNRTAAAEAWTRRRSDAKNA